MNSIEEEIKQEKNKDIIKINNINSNNIIEEQLKSSPVPNFIFKENLYTECDCNYGLNESYDVFNSESSKNNYLITANKNNNDILIINIESKEIIKTLEENSSKFIFIKYYKKITIKQEYLITIDVKGIIKIYEISEKNNFKKIDLISQIITKREFQNNWNFINSTALFNFQIGSKFYDTLLVSIRARYMEEYPTTLYNITNGQSLKEINHTIKNKSRFIIPWLNKNDGIYYLVECCEDLLIIVSILFNKIYAKLDQEKYKSYSSGFIHEKNEIDFLFVANSCGEVNIYNLFSKELCYKIKINPKKENIRLYGLILWSEDYLIANDDTNKSLIIIDLKEKCVLSSINNHHIDSVRCIKRLRHKKYGECLITGGDDHFIKLFICEPDVILPII